MKLIYRIGLCMVLFFLTTAYSEQLAMAKRTTNGNWFAYIPQFNAPPFTGSSDWYSAPFTFSRDAQMDIVPTVGQGRMYRLYYYILTELQVASDLWPFVDDFSSNYTRPAKSEIECIDCAANFWNYAGAHVYLENGGRWSSYYQKTRVWNSTNISSSLPTGYFYPNGIIKIVNPITSGGTTVFPTKTGQIGYFIGTSFNKNGTESSSYMNGDVPVWEILINACPPTPEKQIIDGAD
jgi:hypothetical protein